MDFTISHHPLVGRLNIDEKHVVEFDIPDPTHSDEEFRRRFSALLRWLMRAFRMLAVRETDSVPAISFKIRDGAGDTATSYYSIRGDGAPDDCADDHESRGRWIASVSLWKRERNDLEATNEEIVFYMGDFVSSVRCARDNFEKIANHLEHYAWPRILRIKQG